MEQDDAEDRVEDPSLVVQLEHRDQRHLQRHDEQRNHADEDPVAAREVEPRERVAGHRADDHDEQRVADRDVRGGLQRVEQALVVEERAVVRPRRLARRAEDLPPAFVRERVGREDRRDEQAEGRHEPERTEHDEDDVDRRLRDPAQDFRRRAVARRRQLECGRCSGHDYASLLKRRMFSASTGMTSRNRKTAIAEPVPKSFSPPNAVRHMARAITFAFACVDSGASAITRSNTLSTLMIIVMKTTLNTGASSGTVTRRKTCHSVPPSVRAASSTSRGIAASPAPITTMAKPAQIQMYAIRSDGVISFGPSHE